MYQFCVRIDMDLIQYSSTHCPLKILSSVAGGKLRA